MTDTAQSPRRAEKQRNRISVRSLILLSAWLACSCVLPPLADVLGVDLLLVFLVWALVAGILRAGSTLLDRLLLAGGFLFGILCVAGLLLSVWPWHLQPVPLAIGALTCISLFCWSSGRRPQFQFSLPLADGVALLLAAATSAFVSSAMWHRSVSARIGILILGSDNSRHFSIFDNIRLGGGYQFLRGPQLGQHAWGTLLTYPQGTHLMWAVLDNFLHSDARPGSTLSEVNDFVHLEFLTYGFFALCFLWLTIQVVGPRLMRGWWCVPPLVLASTFLAFGDFLTLLQHGFPSQIMGLTLLGLLVGLLVRSGSRVSKDVLVTSVMLASAVSFTYYFMLPLAFVAVLLWLVACRREVRRQWRSVFAVIITAAATACVPIYINARAAGQIINYPGPVVAISRYELVGISAGLIVALARPELLLSRTASYMTWMLASSVLFAALLGMYQLLTNRGTGYYFEKAIYTFVFLAVPTLATLLAWLLARIASPSGWRAVAAAGAVSVVIAAATAPRSGRPNPYSADRRPSALPADSGIPPSFAWSYTHGRLSLRGAGLVNLAYLRSPRPRGEVTLVWDAFDRPASDYQAAQWIAALQRQLNQRTLDVVFSSLRQQRAGSLEAVLTSARVKIVVVTRNPAVAAEVQDFRARHGPGMVTLFQPT